MASYTQLLAEHSSSTPFTPVLPKSLLQPLSIVSLALFFIFSFYFSTLNPRTGAAKELLSATSASLLGGFGLVFAFCALGVNV